MKTIKNILLMATVVSSLSYSASTVIEDAEDGTTNGWIASAGATVSNIADADSKVIKLSSSSYKYYKMKNLNVSAKNIKWDIKADSGFIAYVYTMTTNGGRLLYYSISNRDGGVTGSGIHHGLSEDKRDGTWNTIERDLEADLQEFEPGNSILKITTFRIRSTGNVFVDNIIADGNNTPPVITLNGDPTETIECNDDYTEHGATAEDDVDGDVDVTISGAVDTSTNGVYTITYSAVDSAGNSATETRIVTVQGQDCHPDCLVLEDAENGNTNGWIASSGAIVSNVTDADTGSKVIKLSSSSYKYYRVDNLNRLAKKLKVDIKVEAGFIAYVYMMTTDGVRLLYYSISNRDMGVTGSGIHHGLPESIVDGEWHTIERDLEADLKEFEPDNDIISIKSFKLRATGDVFVDNIAVCDGNTKPVADAGSDRTILEDTEAQLDGSASTGNPLTYQWVITNKPNGSSATLSDSTLVNPTFIADAIGTYKVQLIVNNATEDSILDIVTIYAAPANDHNLSICNQWSASNSGGQAGTYDRWDISEIPTGASFDFEFEAYDIPDKFQVEYDGTVRLESGWRGSYLPDTGELLEGPGRFDEYGLFIKIDSDTMVVTATGEQSGTGWYYRVRCVENN